MRFGLLPDEGAQYLLVQTIGLPKTLDFLINRKIILPEEALELGMVHEVVPTSGLEHGVMTFATEIANGPQVATRFLKRSIYNAYELSFEQSLDEIAAKTAVSIITRMLAKAALHFARNEHRNLTPGLMRRQKIRRP